MPVSEPTNPCKNNKNQIKIKFLTQKRNGYLKKMKIMQNGEKGI